MSKKKKIISSIIGVMALAYVGCGNSADLEEQADIATTVSVAADATTNDSIEAKEGVTDAALEASSYASTDASSGETVDAVAENSVLTDSSESSTDSNVAGASRNLEAVNASNSTSGTLTGETGPNGWPIIEYNGSADGKGPGLAWVKGYDYLAKEEIMGGTYDGIVAFTASNGVTIKAVLYHSPDGQEMYEPIRGDAKGKDLEPNSPWMVAVKEAQATSWATEDLSANVNATLPNTSYKRNSIDPNDASVVAYKQAYDYKRATVRGGTYYQPNASNVINDSIFFFTDGVGEYDSKGNPLWEFRNTGSYWSLTIYQNPAEYQWSGIREVLEYLSPDGADLYNVIYTDCYTGSEVIQEWDAWWPVGGSQIYQPNPDAVNRILTYYFK